MSTKYGRIDYESADYTSAIRKFLIGMIAVPDHPATPLNPNGRGGFVITEVRTTEIGSIAVRGDNTMWFGEGTLLEIKLP